MSKYHIIITILFCLGTSLLSAQKGLELGGHVGLAHYFGDLNPDFSVTDPGLAVGLKVRRNFNERVSVSGGVDYARISGTDENSNNQFELDRNLNFRSNIVDFNASIEFNFFPYNHGSDDEYYTPYVFTGFSVLTFNPKADFQGETFDLRELMTEGIDYGLATASWFYGIGVKWDYNRDWSFNLALSGRNTASDFIDDVSTIYPTTAPSTVEGAFLSNPSTAEGFGLAGTQRGNSQANDKVFFLTIGIMRYFGQIQCPKITKGLF